MAQVVLITLDAVYRGELELTTPAGGAARLLDVLRSPGRVGQAAIGAEPCVVLHDAVRTPRGGGGAPLGFPQPVSVRPAVILAAYDRGAGGSASKTTYEKRAPEPARVRIFLESRLGIEGTITGGVRQLDAVRGQTFIACTDVDFILGSPQRLPFLAVNTKRIESFSVLAAGSGTS
jgi:hypothetical protein